MTGEERPAEREAFEAERRALERAYQRLGHTAHEIDALRAYLQQGQAYIRRWLDHANRRRR